MPRGTKLPSLIKVWGDGSGSRYALDGNGAPLPQEAQDISTGALRALVGDSPIRAAQILGQPISGSVQDVINAPERLLYPKFLRDYENERSRVVSAPSESLSNEVRGLRVAPGSFMGLTWGADLSPENKEKASRKARMAMARALRGDKPLTTVEWLDDEHF